MFSLHIRGGDYREEGGHVPPNILVGDAKVNVLPLIPHLVEIFRN